MGHILKTALLSHFAYRCAGGAHQSLGFAHAHSLHVDRCRLTGEGLNLHPHLLATQSHCGCNGINVNIAFAHLGMNEVHQLVEEFLIGLGRRGVGMRSGHIHTRSELFKRPKIED